MVHPSPEFTILYSKNSKLHFLELFGLAFLQAIKIVLHINRTAQKVNMILEFTYVNHTGVNEIIEIFI